MLLAQRAWAMSSGDIAHIGTIVPLLGILCECLPGVSTMRCVSPALRLWQWDKFPAQVGEALLRCFMVVYPLHSSSFHALG